MNNSSSTASATDTLAQNKAYITKMEMAFSNGDTAAVDSTMTADFVDHQMPPNAPGTTMQKVNSFMRMFRMGFPDGKTDIKAVTAEGNMVSVYATFSGTNSGSFMGMPATNKMLSMDFADVFRMENGKVAEHWGVMDMMPLMMATDSAKMMKKDKK
jgi:steroid delta-isomerase-like uncharacterized protein